MMNYNNRGQDRNDDLLSKLKNFDAFPKQREEAAEFFHRSVSGGVITLVAAFLMTILFFSELGIYVKVRTVNELLVDTSRGETLQIHVRFPCSIFIFNLSSLKKSPPLTFFLIVCRHFHTLILQFDVTFPKIPCSWISVDAMDISGDTHLDVEHEIYKQRMDSGGKILLEHDPVQHQVGPSEKISQKADGSTDGSGTANNNGNPQCGSCYGAEDEHTPCCNTCSELRNAYKAKGWALNTENVEQCKGQGLKEEIESQRGEGCRVYGDMAINKVAGNIHFAPGRSFQQGSMHIHDLAPFAGEAPFDFSHNIKKMAFGKEYPGLTNPLDGVIVYQPANNLASTGAPAGIPTGGTYQYFLKVVPTSYTTLRNSTISSNQYSVTEHFREPIPGAAQQLPGVFFFYDLSPIKVKYFEERRSLTAFLTSACAIVGGVFTVAGILDATIWAGQRAVRKKNELGKLI
jgi:endoplasmic reticulum-Golgi intermediate compartment protein 3